MTLALTKIIRFICVSIVMGFHFPIQGSLIESEQYRDDKELNQETDQEQKDKFQDLLDTLKVEKNPVILFTNARNEKHIKEWAAHHLLIGFDLVYIFDHKSTIPLTEIFKDFDPRVIIERCELENPVKIPLMLKAASIAKEMQASWLLYLDADEFLILNDYENVKDLLDDFSHADSVAVNWLIFGTCKHVREPQGLILENYTRSDLLIDKHVKTFTRPKQIIDAENPHYYCLADPMKAFSLNNEIIIETPCFYEWPIEYYYAPAYLAHYMYQSEESYIKRKISIPRDDINIFRDIDPFIHRYHNDYENFDPKEKYAEQTKDFLDKYDQKISSTIIDSISKTLED